MREIKKPTKQKKKKKKSRCERRKKELGHLSTMLRSLLRSVLRCLQTSWLATKCRAILRPNDWAHKHIFLLIVEISPGWPWTLTWPAPTICALPGLDRNNRTCRRNRAWRCGPNEVTCPACGTANKTPFLRRPPPRQGSFPSRIQWLDSDKINNKKRKTFNKI